MKPTILDEKLGFNVHRVALLFRRELIRCLRPYHMTPEQWQVMATLWAEGDLKQTEISRITLQDAPSISRMIKRMEKNGWIEKLGVESDSRVTMIRPTTESFRMRDALTAIIENHFQELLSDFPKHKIEKLQVLLLDLRSCLNDYQRQIRPKM